MIKLHLFDQRFYHDTNTGTFYPSVTTVTGASLRIPGLEEWYKKVGMKASELTTEAMARGRRVHNGIENVLFGQTIKFGEIDDEEYLAISRAIEQVKRFKIADKKIEYSFTFEEENISYGGTADLLAYIEEGNITLNRKEVRLQEGWYLIDYKTGNKYPTPHNLQLAAYAHALEQLLDIEIIAGMDWYVESVLKSGNFTISYKDRDELADWYDKFTHVYTVYEELYKIPEPQLLTLPKEIKL